MLIIAVCIGALTGPVIAIQNTTPAEVDGLTEPFAGQQTAASLPLLGDKNHWSSIFAESRATTFAPQITSETQTGYAFQAVGRAFYANDQRIRFTGQEETFGVEGVLSGALLRQFGSWDVGVEAEFFLNQPFDRNILVDAPERISFSNNFDIDPFEISQLFVEATRGDWAISAGKRHTPFGRFYYPLHTNPQFDAPFIRTEVINIRETGLQVDYAPGPWEFTLAFVNGSNDRDTNSAKAGIGRVGWSNDWLTIGGSVKWQDGIGSESQKLRNNHVGLDVAIHRNNWSLSGEVVYDQYGFRRFFDPLDIRFGRSIYNREQFSPEGILSGVGYYVNLTHQSEAWTTVLNFGSYSPRRFTGDTVHDRTTHRFLGKFVRHFGQGLDGVNMIILENSFRGAQAGQDRNGLLLYSGLEYRF